ncbi:monocyte to macrophage differentiation factor 2 isoform X2 [Coturnix japonica]|nr:monocyte to macrophage differentiation factor 2 isoform X2 [Coturnix japonica]
MLKAAWVDKRDCAGCRDQAERDGICPPSSSPPHLYPFAGCERGWLPLQLPPFLSPLFFPRILLLCNRGARLPSASPPPRHFSPDGTDEVSAGPQGTASLAGFGVPRAPHLTLNRPWPRPGTPHGTAEMLASRALDFQKTRYARFMNHRVPSNRRYQPTEYEHAANCATHAFWILPSILGSSILYVLSDDRWETISAWIYGFGLSSLFIVSTIFHTISWKKRHLRTVEHCLHMFDRMVIYFFIAASYAPWLNLRELGPWASHMRWIIWIMASVGTIYVFFFHERYKLVELVCYVIMGFFPALVILSMPNRDGLPELVAGGISYCLGMIFFKSDGRIPFAHAIWHLFVAIGAGIHYYAIWRYLYRPSTLEAKTSR